MLLVGAAADYPAYNKRTGNEATIDDRVNNCMMRSMNGRALPADSRELAALATYLKVLSTGISIGADVIGQGAGSMALLTRERGLIEAHARTDIVHRKPDVIVHDDLLCGRDHP